MIRAFIGVLGVLTAVFPNRIIAIFETVAIENPDEYTRKPWTDSAIRSEGIVVTVASLIGRQAYAWLMNLTGVFGAVVLLFPEAYRDFATSLLYTHPDEVEWNDQFTNRIRLIGIAYIILAVWTNTKRRADD
ncbi:hypothetical protein [Halobellus ordinarius]|uniref:hypothetical protein n=1 Tax=Halobellus ordinarius TaxID=3075120 RepID=UPI00288025AD|nr:hypothetical protein [Halobellus sp. ZY16]